MMSESISRRVRSRLAAFGSGARKTRRQVAFAAAALCALLLPAGAYGNSLNAVSVDTADPTEGMNVAVSVAGSSTGYQGLWLFLRSGTGACSSTAATESSVALRTLLNGRSVNGSFTETGSFSLATPGSYRLCAYIATTSGATPVATSTGTLSIRAATATLSSAAVTTADPAESQPIAVSVSGTSEIYKSLYVYVRSGTASCASTASTESSVATTTLFNGRSVSGSFTETASFSTSTPGTYRICAYVSASNGVTPLAAQTSLTTVRAARATLGVPSVTSADPMEGRSNSVSISGTSEIYKSLWLYLHAGLAPCAATPSVASTTAAKTLISGRSVVGSFTEATTFSVDSPGDYRLCGYVGTGDGTTPLATATGTVRIRGAAASISGITVTTRSPAAGSSVDVRIQGTSEVSGNLYAYAREGAAPCAATPAEESAAESLPIFYSFGQSISSGAFSATDSFYATYGGEYRICAYVATSSTSTPRAMNNAVVTLSGNRRPVTTGCAANGAKLSVSINEGAQYTNAPDVELTLGASSQCAGAVRIAGSPGFGGATETGFARNVAWTLPQGGELGAPSTVYVQFPGIAGTYSDDIILDEVPPRLARVRARTVPGTRLRNGSRLVRFQVRASDSISGVAQIVVTHNRMRATVYRRYASTVTVRVKGNPLRVEVTDRAGNVSSVRTVRAGR